MKLLSKKQISSDFNQQRKMQIDEGVIIAKKVDVLRETLMSLEAQHGKFLAGARQELINATGVLQERKATAEEEIRHLEERRKALLKPLDDQWTELNENKKELKKSLEQLNTLKDDLHERESKITKTEKSIIKAQQKLEELKVVTEGANREAQENRSNSEIIKKALENDRIAQSRDFANAFKALAKRDEENITRRKYLDLVKKNLDLRDKELNDKERFINDKYATLERTIKRFNK